MDSEQQASSNKQPLNENMLHIALHLRVVEPVDVLCHRIEQDSQRVPGFVKEDLALLHRKLVKVEKELLVVLHLRLVDDLPITHRSRHHLLNVVSSVLVAVRHPVHDQTHRASHVIQPTHVLFLHREVKVAAIVDARLLQRDPHVDGREDVAHDDSLLSQAIQQLIRFLCVSYTSSKRYRTAGDYALRRHAVQRLHRIFLLLCLQLFPFLLRSPLLL